MYIVLKHTKLYHILLFSDTYIHTHIAKVGEKTQRNDKSKDDCRDHLCRGETNEWHGRKIHRHFQLFVE